MTCGWGAASMTSHRRRPLLAKPLLPYDNSVMREKQNTTLSVRMTGDEERLVRMLVRRRKSTVSDVIRDAVASYAETRRDPVTRPYEEIADLIGCVTDLPSDLSEATGEGFARIVREKSGRGK
jgi:hypothetical protein